MAEQVTMHHPETGGVATARRAAFEGLWQDKGWVEVTDPAKAAELQAQAEHDARVREVSGGRTVEQLRDETKDVLADVATSLGQDVSPKDSKKDLVEKVEKAPKP